MARTKTCARCDKPRLNDNYYQGYTTCKKCTSIVRALKKIVKGKAYKKQVLRQVSRVRTRNQKFVDDLKSVPCTDCRHKYPPYVMDFDHVRGKKLSNVAALVGARCSEKRILTEVKKCDVVCSNCHRIRTHNRK